MTNLMFEASDTMGVLGISDHNARNYIEAPRVPIVTQL